MSLLRANLYHGRWPFFMVQLDGPNSMLRFLEESIFKAFEPLTRYTSNVDQEDHAPKFNVLLFSNYICPWRPVSICFLSSLTILLASRVFTFCFCLFSPWIPASMVAMKEKRRILIFLWGLYMFLYVLVKHVVDIQALLVKGKLKKFAILSLIYESMRHKYRSIGSQERMCGFKLCLLLGSWMKNSLGNELEWNKLHSTFFCKRLDQWGYVRCLGFCKKW